VGGGGWEAKDPSRHSMAISTRQYVKLIVRIFAVQGLV
jgi:hypothetical protein